MKPLYVDVTKLIDHPGEELYFDGPLPLEPTKLGAELIDFPRPADLDVVLRGVSEGIIIQGRAKVGIRLLCGRCLEKFDYDTQISIDELAVKEGAPGLTDEVFPIAAGKIDLAAIVYQNIMVEVPIQPLCRRTCAGLCAVCGKNLNEEPHAHAEEKIDERLAPLKKYFEQR